MTVDTSYKGKTGAQGLAYLNKFYTGDTQVLEIDHGLQVDGNIVGVGGVPTVSFGAPILVAHASASSATTTATLSYTPPAAAGTYLAQVYVKVTTGGTSTIPKIAYTDEDGTAVSAAAISCISLAGTALLTSFTVTGHFSGRYEFGTDNSATAIVLTITPTGSTFNYDLSLERIA